MADITMCVNTECPNTEHCYRAQAKASDFQSWAVFEYVVGRQGVECEDYLPIVNDAESK